LNKATDIDIEDELCSFEEFAYYLTRLKRGKKEKIMRSQLERITLELQRLDSYTTTNLTMNLHPDHELTP